MKLSFRQTKNISIFFILTFVFILSLIPWITYQKISAPLQSFLTSLSSTNDAFEIINLVNAAREDFDRLVKGKTSDFDRVTLNIDKAIEMIDIVSERNRGNLKITDKADLLKKESKKFKSIIVFYFNEIEYDPSADTLDQLEKMVIQTQLETMASLFVFVDYVTRDADHDVVVVKTILKNNKLIAIFSLSGAMLLAVLGTILMTKALSSPLNQLILGTKKIAEGNFNFRVNVTDKDEIGELGNSFNIMTKRLQLEREQLQSIVDSMPLMLWGIDSSGKLCLINETASKLIGYSLSDIKNEKLWDIIPQFNPVKKQILEIVASGQIKIYNRQQVVWKNEKQYFEVTIYPLKISSDMTAIILVRNVTQSVLMEESVLQSEKMISVGGLAAGMAHEINNPLSGIMQSASVLINRLSVNLPANEKAASQAGTSLSAIQSYMEKRNVIKLLDNIHSAGRNAADIVENMLSFSIKGDFKKENHSVSEMLIKTLDLAKNDYDLKKKYDFKKIKIIKEFDDLNVPDILCEESKILQVFFNIIKNAAQAMYEGMENFEQAILILRVFMAKDMVQIEIEDNGPGINEAVQKRVFEPFFTTKKVSQGTGLGLSISYYIITENHGGAMSVQSIEKSGSRFVIKLPIHS
ncbi:MAG: ATP-binding protein [Desulfobacula sp.]|nr:ATP-binding protein [Desulfobacula sp.]